MFSPGDIFSITLDGPPELAWNVVKRIGGDNGWYFGTCLWQLRGFVDEMLGGPGLSRGRRHVNVVALGDHLDFWRVVAVEELRRLLLRAEMLAPGELMATIAATIRNGLLNKTLKISGRHPPPARTYSSHRPAPPGKTCPNG
jgi:hypothetical protein